MSLNQFLKDRKQVCIDLVNELEKEYVYVSVLGSYSKSKKVISSTRESAVSESEDDCGFVIKVYDGTCFKEYSCNDVAGLTVENIKEHISMNHYQTGYVKVRLMEEQPLVKSFERADLHVLPDEEVMQRLTEVRNYLQNYDPRIIMVHTMYVHRETSSVFVSSKRVLDQFYEWNNAAAVAIVRDGQTIQQYFGTAAESDTLLTLTKLSSMKEEIAEKALHLLDATAIEPGVYDVITDPSISGLIAHEAFGHGVEMDMFVKNRAKAKDYVGKYVASPVVNMRDGAASCISAASYFFDDDGVLAHDTQIIKDGILQTGISDALSAYQLGTEPTGNGRRQGFDRKSYTRMTNTFFEAGKDKLEDMIASIQYGYYLCNTDNGMEDPKNWQIQCTAAYGLEIRDGKFTGKIVAPVVISGSVTELLGSITMVSDQLEVHGMGMCGKGCKEWVYVADGGPHLKARAKLG